MTTRQELTDQLKEHSGYDFCGDKACLSYELLNQLLDALEHLVERKIQDALAQSATPKAHNEQVGTSSEVAP
jgi:hypothetical protein